MRHINYRKGNPEIPLTPYQEEVITGELLGDGSIRTHATPHAHCSARWRLKGKEHAEFLYEVFSNFSPRLAFYSNAWELQLSSNPTWDRLRSLWYPSGKKALPPVLKLSPVVCFHFYIGDGSLDRPKGNVRRIALSAHDFAGPDLQILQEMFRAIGFEFKAINPGVLRGSAKDWRRFLDYISYRAPLQCYAHKWNMEVPHE